MADENAAEKESPTIRKTRPSWASMERVRISLCRCRSAAISSGYFWASRVEPSISVNKNVTVPVGSLLMRTIQGAGNRFLERHGSARLPCLMNCRLIQLCADHLPIPLHGTLLDEGPVIPDLVADGIRPGQQPGSQLEISQAHLQA